MIDQAKMNQLKEYGAAAALELRGEIAAALKAQTDETLRAVNGYFSDRKEKEKALSDRIEALKDQKTELEERVANYAPRLANATLSGDSADLENIQVELTNLEAQKSAIAAQIGLLSGVAVSGDKELFSAADEMARALDQFWTETLADLSTLAIFADEQSNLWRQVANLSTLGGDLMPRNAVFSRVEAMKKDFHEKEGVS